MLSAIISDNRASFLNRSELWESAIPVKLRFLVARMLAIRATLCPRTVWLYKQKNAVGLYCNFTSDSHSLHSPGSPLLPVVGQNCVIWEIQLQEKEIIALLFCMIRERMQV